MVFGMLRYGGCVPFAKAIAGGAALAFAFSSVAVAQQAGSSASSNAALAKRVEQLEEQLVDLRVVIGTLESLARSGGGSSSAVGSSFSGNEAARLQGLETQVRALTSQVEQLSRQVRAEGGGQLAPAGNMQSMESGPGMGMSGATAAVETGPDYAAQDFGGFGSTTITSGAEPEDPIGGLLSQSDGGFGFGTQAAAAPMGGGGDPKQLYEAAYGYLLQQDYGAAEAAFDDFLKRHPSDQLSGNAQYWLGETYFVRSQYKAAAAAFLKGYETYRQSAKAPDSLLKLAMSLDRLGQREAACTSYRELNTQFPDAPAHVRDRAASERSRSGC